MRALVWHGKKDVRYDPVSDPEIQDPRDAIVKVTSCAICGSDLHLFHNVIPAMLPGGIKGHEMMGEVVDVGSGMDGRLRKDERIGRREIWLHAMMNGEADVVSGWHNKLQSAIDNIIPTGIFAEQHWKMTEPGSAKKIHPSR